MLSFVLFFYVHLFDIWHISLEINLEKLRIAENFLRKPILHLPLQVFNRYLLDTC